MSAGLFLQVASLEARVADASSEIETLRAARAADADEVSQAIREEAGTGS